MDKAGSAVILPPGTPLIAGIETASGLLGVSVKRLRELRQEYDDFPAGKLGANTSNLLFDVPRCYDWFARHIGTA